MLMNIPEHDRPGLSFWAQRRISAWRV